MTKADKTIRDLGHLYDFYREIKKTRLRHSASSKAVEATRDNAAGSRSLFGVSDREPPR
jgi:hypothetical protein